MAAALREILQMIPAGNWKSRFKADPVSDKPLVCWALVEMGLTTHAVCFGLMKLLRGETFEALLLLDVVRREPRVARVKRLAARVHPATLYKLAREGKIPSAVYGPRIT